MVPGDQGRRRPRLRRLPLLLRGPDHQDAGEQAHRRRLPGHQHLADQPGRARHRRLGAAADERARATIIATGSIAYPPEWAHASPDRIKALGRLEGDDDDLDLRPPGHPGRRVGLLPAPDRAAAAGRGRLLRGGRRATSGSRRRSSPPPTPPPPRRRRWARPPRAAVAQRSPSEELLQAVQAATSLLKAYRTHGHLAARLDPLGSEPKGDPAIQPENLNLTPELMAQIPASILRIGVPGRDPARGAAADARGLLRHDRPTRSSTSPRTSSGCGCGR